MRDQRWAVLFHFILLIVEKSVSGALQEGGISNTLSRDVAHFRTHKREAYPAGDPF